MSDPAEPFDDKRGNRTIVVDKSDAGQLQQPRSTAAADPALSKSAPELARGEAQRTSLGGDGAAEDWIRARERPAAPAGHLPPLPDIDLDELASPHDNPIMRAAGPLLILLGRLRAAALRAPFAGLMEQVAEAMRFFEKDIRTAGIPEEQARSAKYVLCATADDIVQNIPTDDRHVWTRYSMLARFFNERIGGVRFFEEMDRAKLDPVRNFFLLELQYTCMALGFQGVHRSSPDGRARLQRIQRETYELLRQVRPRVARELSPHWHGVQLQRNQVWFRLPVWAVASVVGLMLFMSYVVFRVLLSGVSEVAIDRLNKMLPTDEVSVAQRLPREPPPPPQPSPPPAPKVEQPPPPPRITQLQRIRSALGPEIDARKVDAFSTNSMIVIRVGDLILFPSDSARLRKEFEPIGRRIAQVLDKEPRRIHIVGHTDNTPISATSRFKSNKELSEERAKAVATIVRQFLTDPARVAVRGRADLDPLRPNDTKEGRAFNRRVDLLLERDD